MYNMFNTQNAENQILFSGTYFRPNKGMPSPPFLRGSEKESSTGKRQISRRIYNHAWPKQSCSDCRKKQTQLDQEWIPEHLALLAAVWLNDVQL